MQVLSYEDFVKNCEKGFCLRQTLHNKKTCRTESKQKSCYSKYITKLEKQQLKFLEALKKPQGSFEDSVDFKWEVIKKAIWERDTNTMFKGEYSNNNWLDLCVVFNKIFTQEERSYVLNHFSEDLSFSYRLSNMHIESRQRNPKLKYDLNNIILAGNYFHDLFDNFIDLVTRENMDNDRRNYWIKRFKKYIEEIGE